MGNILQHSGVTFPLVLTGGMCPESGCVHQQSELDITEAPNERSGFIPSNDPPREQPQLFTHLCTGKYLLNGRQSWKQRKQGSLVSLISEHQPPKQPCSASHRWPSSDQGSPMHALSTRYSPQHQDLKAGL